MLDILPNFFNTISFLLKKSCVFEFVLAKETSIKEPGLTPISFLKDLIDVIISIILLTSLYSLIYRGFSSLQLANIK